MSHKFTGDRYKEATNYAKSKKYDISDEEKYELRQYINTGQKSRPAKPTQEDRNKIIPAKDGFHGYVDHPTHFLVGEYGKERVNITPVKPHKIHHDRKNKNYYDVDLQDIIGDFKW